MILVTGVTGFIGQVLTRHLVELDYQVRILIRPSMKSPRLPKGVNIEVAVAGLNDSRGLRASLVGVSTVYHLAGVERRGASADLLEVDIQGTRNLIDVAKDAKVDRFFFVSHLGSERASAFPVLKAKAISEEYIRRSGIDYTILKTAIVYGSQDGFTTGLAQLLHALPFLFLIPGDGNNLIQPLWVEDLVTCLAWSLEDDDTRRKNYEIGGPEFLTLNEVLKIVMKKLGIRRTIVPVIPPFLRVLTVLMEYIFPSSPVSVFWLDYLSTNRTCALDTIPRVFNLIPSRFSQQLGYLQGVNWRRSLFESMFKRSQ